MHRLTHPPGGPTDHAAKFGSQPLTPRLGAPVPLPAASTPQATSTSNAAVGCARTPCKRPSTATSPVMQAVQGHVKECVRRANTFTRRQHRNSATKHRSNFLPLLYPVHADACAVITIGWMHLILGRRSNPDSHNAHLWRHHISASKCSPPLVTLQYWLMHAELNFCSLFRGLRDGNVILTATPRRRDS